MTSYNYDDPNQLAAMLLELGGPNTITGNGNSVTFFPDNNALQAQALMGGSNSGGGGSSYSSGGGSSSGGSSGTYKSVSQSLADPAELALQKMLGLAGIAQDKYAVDAQTSIAQGQLGLGNRQLDLDREIANLENALGQGRLNLDTQLGQGNLALGQDRLALDKLLGENAQKLQAGQLYAERATRQLNAPGGQIRPSLQPIVGRSQI